MNFRKVSDHELRCSVTIDEIHENGLEVSDLLKKTEKTYSFFEYLVQEAGNRVRKVRSDVCGRNFCKWNIRVDLPRCR